MSSEVHTVSDYVDIFRRRSLLLGGTIFILALAFVAVAYVWPPTYLSSGTILIEQQDVPEELVRSTVTDFAEERIQIVTQRVMTSARLAEIIDEFNLYSDISEEGEGAQIERFRADTTLDTLRADLANLRGRELTSTIAFTVGYQNESPEVAKKVAQRLVELYLSENARSRAEAATETSAFLNRRSQDLDEELRRLEQRMAEFKQQNSESLPDLQSINRDRLETARRDIESVSRDIRTLRDSISLLESELALMSPFAAYETEGATMAAPQRLDSLQREYIALSSRYAPSHPDVVRVRREIELLTGGNVAQNLMAVEERLYEARQRLATATDQYTESHPEVARLRRQIQDLETERARVLERSVNEATPTNPLYVQKEGQLKSTRNQLAAAEERLESLQSERQAYEARLAQSPQVERDLAALERDYDAKLAQFREIQAKLESAELAETLEIEQRGERFAVIDPPKVPQEPISPNRMGIILLGVVVAVGAGLGLVTLVDSMDTTVRSARDVADLFDTLPLASIMYLETPRDARIRRTKTLILTGAALASIAAVAVLIV